MTAVDLRSDTVTQPTPGMREAMAVAPLGDDVFGDDPSVNALQEKIAGMLGFEAALFVPTGTQSNLCGVLAHCQRGDEYIVGQQQHCYRWEGGGVAVFGSVQPQPLDHQPDGTLDLDAIADAIKPDDPHFARTRLLSLENTLGGKVIPMDYIAKATELARAKGLARHLDGARLFNAAVASVRSVGSVGSVHPELVEGRASTSSARTAVGVARTEAGAVRSAVEAARQIAQHFDSVSVCFSKGLGAPVGSALCGSRELIGRARRIRKMAGGAMRQAGVLAAAASFALDHQVARLADDHALARRLAEGLAGIDGLKVEPPQTNILFVDLVGAARERSQQLIDHLNTEGVLATGLYRLRFVTHLGVDAGGIDHAASAIRRFFNA
ncbi:GntG family PLP-dependent aldolase [Ramlibacter sp.]|uniref:GntG family PLP-dependent aldolase n=1 Tax=Ramlibacter sp. TaxID=1917967 RepID=UPI0017D35B9C|nr:GntG family PLP-dependent aldolase [Ramlibacter sp.]MBA2673943.1 low-specificity L-threonine aldolase [Ramlibacter sp.]